MDSILESYGFNDSHIELRVKTQSVDTWLSSVMELIRKIMQNAFDFLLVLLAKHFDCLLRNQWSTRPLLAKDSCLPFTHVHANKYLLPGILKANIMYFCISTIQISSSYIHMHMYIFKYIMCLMISTNFLVQKSGQIITESLTICCIPLNQSL